MTLPILRLQGRPYQQGFDHGRELRADIAANLENYFRRFEQKGGLARDRALYRAAKYLEVIERENIDYFSGLKGIADGAGADLEVICALNVRYEILCPQFTSHVPDGCTSFALIPQATVEKSLILGQNWDWIGSAKGAIVSSKEDDGLLTVGYTEAGVFGMKMGFNSVGLGLAMNGLDTMADDWSRLGKPFHVANLVPVDG